MTGKLLFILFTRRLQRLARQLSLPRCSNLRPWPKNNNKRRWLICCLILCSQLLFSLSNLAAAQTQAEPDRVLFIASYHPGFPTFFDQVSGLESVLKSPEIKLDIEFMDAKRFDNQQLEGIFYQNLARKLEQLNAYDLVITADDAATHFAVNHQAELFAQTPIVFFGVNDLGFAQSLEAQPGVTGLAEKAAISDTVQLSQTLFPGGTLYVIADHSASGLADLQRLQSEMQQQNFQRYQLLLLNQLGLDELLSQASKLKPPDALLILSLYQDAQGSSLDFDQVLARLHQTSAAPIFHLWPHGLGEGVLGGKLLSQKTQAQAAAHMALRILKGTDPKQIPVQMESPSEYAFDYRELQRFGLTNTALPTNSQLINAPDPIYVRYRNYIAASALVLACLAAAVLLLIARIRQRKRVEKKIRRLNSHLENKVKQRTQELANSNRELQSLLQLRDTILDNSLVSIVLIRNRQIEWVNGFTQTMFGYAAEEVIGRNTEFIYVNHQDYLRVAEEAGPVLSLGETYSAEYAYKRKDGKIIWGVISAKALNPEDIKEGVVFIINDISARKKAEDALQMLNQKLEQQATTDHLTGVNNRRHMNQLLNAELNRSKRYHSHFAIILIDIDHFKNLNDTYGHNIGDKVLVGVARLLAGSIREVETLARWGGEEFLILCPNSKLFSAQKLAELLRQRLERKSFEQVGQVTASFGVAEFNSQQSLEDLIYSADTALYSAKEMRNCVHCANLPTTH